MPFDFKAELAERVDRARASPAYASYQRAREAVCRMMDDWALPDPGGNASAYWKEELAGFLYLFDASPLIVENLRDQAHHITGIKSYEYRSHHEYRAPEFESKYKALAEIDATGLWVPDPPDLGGFGFEIGGGLVNIDTLKFFEVLIGMDRSGALKRIENFQSDRQVVVEIGSGWGGFAYQFKTLFPHVTYVCVDLPPTMLFSATYLLSMFPNAKMLFYGDKGFEQEVHNYKSYDFVFMPHYYFPVWDPKSVDLAVNMVSFQEMTSDQVEGYIKTLRELGCPRLYSMNRDRSRHNTQLTAVSKILERYYKYKQVPVLDLQYTHLKPSSKPKGELNILDYRHYYAWA